MTSGAIAPSLFAARSPSECLCKCCASARWSTWKARRTSSPAALYEKEIPPAFEALLAQRPGAVILMDTSVDPEIVALTGIPLRQTINESDLEIYSDALAAPAAHAAFVLAFDGDEIDQAVQGAPRRLDRHQRFTAPGQPSATLYVSDTGSAHRQDRDSTSRPAWW